MGEISDIGLTFKPKRVATLFVGESSPAQGTHFYRADSNLFRAICAAFAAAFGETVGEGEAFLRTFKARGCWLVDIAAEPVNRMDAAERRALVAAGIPALAETIAATKPQSIVVVKSDIGTAVAQAVELGALRKPPAVVVLRYPLRQYRAEFIEKLADLLRAGTESAAA